MIISASRRTDLPAFYSKWFMNRVRAGYFTVPNPFNPNQVRRVSMFPEDVDAIVFWSKSPAPLLQHLPELDSMGFRYYFQFTLNDYPRVLEPNLPPLEERLATFQRLSGHVGPSRVVWRNDPIVLSTVTPVQYHLEHLEDLAKALEGSTNRLVISLMDFYGRVTPRLRTLERSEGIAFYDVVESPPALTRLLEGICAIAQSRGMEVFSCCEAATLEHLGVRQGACIDGALMSRLFGLPYKWEKDKHQREECLCVKSVDMGVYNTCSFGCRYCYASLSQKLLASNLAKHDVDSPSIIGHYEADYGKKEGQLDLPIE